MWIPLFCRLIDLRAARITEPDRACHLVKRLACCIVSGASQNLKFAIIFHNHQMCMSA